MYHIYENNYRITQEPVSYNQLLKMLSSVVMSWNKVSTMSLGDCVAIDNYKIVRAV